MRTALQLNRRRANRWVWLAVGLAVTTPLLLAQTRQDEPEIREPSGAWDDKEPSSAGAIVADDAKAQTEDRAQEEPAWIEATDVSSEPTQPAQMSVCPSPYQLWVLAPPLAAIILAIAFRAVVPALVIGVLVGGYMMIPDLTAGDASYQELPKAVGGFCLAAEKYVVGAIIDPKHGFGHAKIIIFTMAIGFMVGVIGRNGGSAGMVRLVAGDTESPRRGRFTAWLAGMLVFFDDYANTMIVGPTMRPVFDRLKISRAKLAYIVDSTAAPIASIFIGTWVGTEIGFIQDGIDDAIRGGVPAFLTGADGSVNVNGMSVFWSSIPYRFYAVLALVAVFLVSVLGRDFGPMKKSESRALSGQDDRAVLDVNVVYPPEPAKPRWWLGFAPVFVLVAVTIGLLLQTGYAEIVASTSDPSWWQTSKLSWWQKFSEVLGEADPYSAIFYGAIVAAIVAILLTVASRACSIKDAADAGLEGMMRISAALVILVLAWALSRVAQDMKLGEVVTYYLVNAGFPIQWMPLSIFLAAAGVSFATGTAWGTMGILTPMAVAVSIQLAVAAGLPTDEAMPLFLAAVGAVLAGSVFGDHCSPISDTTVLSSLASSCRHEEHVWTQIPYALVTALVAGGCGHIMCDVYGLKWYYGLGTGVIVLFLILLIFGRRPKPLPVARQAPIAPPTVA